MVVGTAVVAEPRVAQVVAAVEPAAPAVAVEPAAAVEPEPAESFSSSFQ